MNIKLFNASQAVSQTYISQKNSKAPSLFFFSCKLSKILFERIFLLHNPTSVQRVFLRPPTPGGGDVPVLT